MQSLLLRIVILSSLIAVTNAFSLDRLNKKHSRNRDDIEINNKSVGN